MNTETITQLLERYFHDQATLAEQEALFKYLEENPGNEQWETLLLKFIPEAVESGEREEKYNFLVKSVLGKLKVRNSKRRWLAVAASVIALLGVGLYFYTNHKTAGPVAVAAPDSAPITAPSANRATITLADGSVVYLDSVANGQLAQLGNIQLVKLANGQIAYRTADGQILKEPQNNTLTNPRGSRIIDMQLSDGSHVWLNAGSSITYPVFFTGNERTVTLEGEAYFEVTEDKSKPFYVRFSPTSKEERAGTVEVLGTYFNVNAYSDEENIKEIKVTLLEGSVRVSNPGIPSRIINPGQQAGLTKNGISVRQVDLNDIMSWKNGYFNLNDLAFTEIMNQLERWYDIDAVYPAGVPNIGLFGKIGRDLSLAETLTSLGDMGVRCRMEGKRLIITK